MPADPVFYPDDYEGYPLPPEDEYIGGFRVTRDRGLTFLMAKGKFIGGEYVQRIAPVQRRGVIPGAGDWWVWVADDDNLTIRVTRKDGSCSVSSNTTGSTLLTNEAHGLTVGQSFTTAIAEGGLPIGTHYVLAVPSPKSIIVSATMGGEPRVLAGNGATSILITGGNNVTIKSVLGSVIACSSPHGIVLTKGRLQWKGATNYGLINLGVYSVPLVRAITDRLFILPSGVNLTGTVTGYFTVDILPDYTSFACAIVSADTQKILTITDVRPPYFLRPFSILDGIPEWTETSRGILRKATETEANNLQEDDAGLTPKKLPISSITQKGLVQLAEHTDSTSDNKAITPAYLSDLAANDPNPFASGDKTYSVDSQIAMLALLARRGDVAVRTDLLKAYRLKQSPTTNIANWVHVANLAEPVYPAVTGNKTYTESSQSAMLALAADQGDIVKRIDLGRCFRLTQLPPSVLANWTDISSSGSASNYSQIIALR